MVFGGRVVDSVVIDAMLNTMVRLSVPGQLTEIDTALIYPMLPNKEGLTERILSESLARLKLTERVQVHSKLNPWCDDRFSRAGVEAQMRRIESNLSPNVKVDLLYLHAPDHVNRIEDTLIAVNELHRAGRFVRFGLSNYSAWQVADIVGICKLHNFVVPTVYQGLYNAISRDVERELLPCLAKLNIAFYAYNATAGGLLTGKHTIDNMPTEGRFTSEVYRKRYWLPAYFAALDKVRDACVKESVPVADAAHRWLVHHSKLRAGDKIIVGASSVEQLEQNTAACRAAPLPDSIVAALDEANDIARPSWPSYFR
jgi:aflatoxin B1 aldehyde reductase